MALIKIKPRRSFTVPIEAKCISPDVFASRGIDEIAKLMVWEGNRRHQLGELFNLEGEGGDGPKETVIEVLGDVSKVRRVGFGMTDGRIIVDGDIGMYVGEEMAGGSIIIRGDAGSWAGSSMMGGFIEIEGSVGDYVGGSYRGTRKGMMGGLITIHGNAGCELGSFMGGGIIIVEGDVGLYPGIHMKDGSILIKGGCRGRAGAEMVGGKIVILGHTPSILPCFSIEEVRPRVKVGDEKVEGPFYVFIGDLNADGDGRLFISEPSNPHLGFYKEYIE